ncbi:amidase family protein [Rhizobium leguminosarum]|jgi:amidase|uniref:amidase family protein n=1 Tax=Rhizobium leguminosarum TaxID=384 RepID=UPI0010409327|nr:amidase family protein [Rhizobium leguminosarum]MBY5470442.1 amidase [Rhizobium leguminosarum]MBY5905050.1 amidase [Rhizobium leguminosarum]MBY5912141.1 amidase [Rhizobium leguminosarum]MDI5927506.1 amidase family protein [Rhizobium leguminosarum]NKK93154.1 amidase [Rhizobium leguminosarum bv. viciae]
MQDRWNAFMPYPDADVGHAAIGPLSGLRLAVKDLFDVAGYPTAAGNATVLAASGIKPSTAPLVQTLLDAGVCFVGKTNTDELAYSLIGGNIHFGMPINPRDPNLIPGGSSSGSAVAVAAGLADIGLGTDTSGSIRLPAAVNGLIGWRPTHGSLDNGALRPLAPTFDVPGFMTRSLEPMATVMSAVGVPAANDQPSSILIPEDIFQTIDDAVADEMIASLRSADMPIRRTDTIASFSLADLALAFITILQREAWESNQILFERSPEAIAPDIAERLLSGSRVDDEEVREARRIAALFSRQIDRLLCENVIVALPTLAMNPPTRDAAPESFAAFRAACIKLLCLSGLSGCPQLAFPIVNCTGNVSLSLFGARSADRMLMNVARRLTAE